MNIYEKNGRKYRMIWDYHTHTIFSHGIGTIEDNVKIAIEKGTIDEVITMMIRGIEQ